MSDARSALSNDARSRGGSPMIGLGTVINVMAIVIGSAIGVALGHRLSERTRDVVTDGLGLVVLLVAALSAAAVTNEALGDVVGSAAVIVVLAAIIIGGVIGSMLRIEDRMEELGMWVRQRFAVGTTAKVSIPDITTADAVEQTNQGELAAAQRFVDGFVTASLVFCVGPLAIMGALNDGLGLGIEQLALKSGLDGFASIAFAATLGWGVAVSAVAVALYQGSWTLLGVLLGDVLAEAQIAALTATGGLLLVGIGLRLLRVNTMRVGDLLPSLFIAPLIVGLWSAFGQN